MACLFTTTELYRNNFVLAEFHPPRLSFGGVMPPTPSFASLQYGLPYTVWQAIITFQLSAWFILSKLAVNQTTRLSIRNDKHNAIWQIKRYFRSDACCYDIIHRRRSMTCPDKQLAGPEINEFQSLAGDVSVEHFRWQRYADSWRQLQQSNSFSKTSVA